MKKIILLNITLALSCYTALFAQSAKDAFVSKSVTIQIAASNIANSKKILLANVDTSMCTIITFNENNETSGAKIYMVLNTNKAGYEKIEKIIPQLGFLDDEKLNSVNNAESIEKIELEINFLKNKKASFDSEKNNLKDDDRISYWNNVRETDQEIFNLEKKKSELKNQVYFYTVTIDLYEDIGTPQSSSNMDKVQFVNMPGIGVTRLSIENPTPKISNSTYMGYEIKYLFTRGKSYAVIGGMKAQNIPQHASDSLYTDLFMYGFGQDFYPKHLGKGRRKFLNLYSGYRLGGAFATSKSHSVNLFYLTPHMGLELIKTKYILLDIDGGYFVPFYENYNLRGFQLNASFNFVF